jgi:hypothetical protein
LTTCGKKWGQEEGKEGAGIQKRGPIGHGPQSDRLWAGPFSNFFGFFKLFFTFFLVL